MSEDKKPGPAKVMKDFFGYRPGDKLADFAAELSALSEEDKQQLVNGIEDRSLNY